MSNFPFYKKIRKGEEEPKEMLEVLTQCLKNLDLRKILKWNPKESAFAGFKPLILTTASPL